MASGESVATPPPKRKSLASKATRDSPEIQAFRRYSGTLIDTILDPNVLAWQLYQNDIISSATRDRALLRQQIKQDKNSVLLSAIEGRINVEPQVFRTFVELLRVHDDTHLRVLGQRIAAAHGKYSVVYRRSFTFYIDTLLCTVVMATCSHFS